MSTLLELSRPPCGTRWERDACHYGHLVEAWCTIKQRWPEGAAAAGEDSLLWAVALAFFYKGQTDYPDGEDTGRLVEVLSRCSQLDPDPAHDETWAEVLGDLTRVAGVGLPRASVLLHCLHPDHFPIVDYRAAGALCRWADQPLGWPESVPRPSCKKEGMTQTPKGYLDYRRILLALVDASGRLLDLRRVEFALYQAGRDGHAVTGLV